MRVLVLFERSGIVREAFRSQGHDAWSCDAEPAEDAKDSQSIHDPFATRHHIQLRVNLAILTDPGVQVNNAMGVYLPWDLVIVHPDCTHLAVSGALRFKDKQSDGRQARAIADFMACTRIQTPRLCIENPICIMSTLWRKPDQIIQPYQFGDDASKKTCLWLRGLPKLTINPAQYVQPRIVDGNNRWANQTDSGL